MSVGLGSRRRLVISSLVSFLDSFWYLLCNRLSLQAGDIVVLDRISALMRGASPSPSPSTSCTLAHLGTSPEFDSQLKAKSKSPEGKEAKSKVPKTQKEKDALVLEGARICVVLAQGTAILEGDLGDDTLENGSSFLWLIL